MPPEPAEPAAPPAPAAPAPFPLRSAESCGHCSRSVCGVPHVICGVCPSPGLALCLDCFSVGAAGLPHSAADHAFSVTGDVSTEVYEEGWAAWEEERLLEAVLELGFGHWDRVAAMVGGGKTEKEVLRHYERVYLEGSGFFLEGEGRVLETSIPEEEVEKEREKRRERDQARKQREIERARAGKPKPRKKIRKLESRPSYRRGKGGGSSARLDKMGKGKGKGGAGSAAGQVDGTGTTDRKGGGVTAAKDGDEEVVEAEGPYHAGIRRPQKGASSVGGGPEWHEAYREKRADFDIEFDDAAEEELLADVAISDDDSEEAARLKMRLMELYNMRLAERERMKQVVLDGGVLKLGPVAVLHAKPEGDESEREVRRWLDRFRRVLDEETFSQLRDAVLEEESVVREIEKLKAMAAMEGSETRQRDGGEGGEGLDVEASGLPPADREVCSTLGISAVEFLSMRAQVLDKAVGEPVSESDVVYVRVRPPPRASNAQQEDRGSSFPTFDANVRVLPKAAAANMGFDPMAASPLPFEQRSDVDMVRENGNGMMRIEMAGNGFVGQLTAPPAIKPESLIGGNLTLPIPPAFTPASSSQSPFVLPPVVPVQTESTSDAEKGQIERNAIDHAPELLSAPFSSSAFPTPLAAFSTPLMQPGAQNEFSPAAPPVHPPVDAPIHQPPLRAASPDAVREMMETPPSSLRPPADDGK